MNYKHAYHDIGKDQWLNVTVIELVLGKGVQSVRGNLTIYL